MEYESGDYDNDGLICVSHGVKVNRDPDSERWYIVSWPIDINFR